ncbi:lysophospholipid acyltransferase family protein [Christensenella hongkongensis]|uniref:lysophospholipid acyltransferase family protein n=1 Tax=Christensenella hongkongensis TaxID=270498 RepID=UPI002671394C|nr:lysophospholipid acyltransferase family protein [Christensenella hongkongensis]
MIVLQEELEKIKEKESIKEEAPQESTQFNEKARTRRKGPAERMWAPIKLHLNEDYQYMTKNLFWMFFYYLGMVGGMPFGYLFFKIRWGFGVIDKKNAKLVKKTAAITVANHVHNMDSPMLTYVFYPSAPYFVALKHNFEAFIIGGLVRVLRGVPLPSDLKNFEHFSEQMNDTLTHTTRKVHMYPEGEIAPYCKELRRFKNGAFHFAIKNNVPVLPLVFVFPKKKKVKLIVGKPVYLKDVPGTEGEKPPKQTVLMGRFVKAKMQQMLDDYYGGLKQK